MEGLNKENVIPIQTWEIPTVKSTVYTKYIKRCLDVIISGIAIILLIPIYLCIVLLELIYHGRPVMYKSQRPGKDGVLFYLVKFRSMTNECDETGKLLPAAQRVTPFGRFLRRYSLDELTDLFCVFTGKMSIIGPRPLLTEYLPLYNERHRYRLSVKPGLICLKVDGNDKITTNTWTWYNQFENDIFYVENCSFLIDVKMVFKAFKAVFVGSDMRTNADRVRFDGTNLYETRPKSEVDKNINKII